MIEIACCLICNRTQPRPSYIFPTHRYVQCPACGYLWQSPVKEPAALACHYGASYRDYEIRNADNFLSLAKLGLQDIHFFSYAAQHLPGRKLLDIGCAIGTLVHYFTAQGWDARGIDICRESVAHGIARYQVELSVTDLAGAGFAAHTFDAIHASHVIEHVLAPDCWLKEIHRLLKPGGVLLLTTPNRASFQARLTGQKWRGLTENHVQLFGKRNLLTLLTKLDFTIIRHLSWGGIPRGQAPAPIKQLADTLVKIIDQGDVQMVFCRK